MSTLWAWLRPSRPADIEVITDPGERRALVIELAVVFTITLGMSGLQSLLALLDALLRPEPLGDQHVAINEPQAAVGLLDMLQQLTGVVRLCAWGGLGVFLLWRGGIALSRIGLDRSRPGQDALGGLGLAALIGIPGLGLYLLAHALGLSLTVEPSTLDAAWWRAPVLSLSAFGNAFAEEILVVAYLLTRLRQLGWGENRSLWTAAVLRGSYHLYQGAGGFAGNVIMGLIYGRIWQRKGRVWPLVVGHTLIDIVAFVGYSALRGSVAWLP